jgi:hypothetical protein
LSHLLSKTQPIFAPAISAGDRLSADQTSFSRDHHAIPFNWSMSLENSPQASSKGTAADRMLMTYWLSQQNARKLTRGEKLSSHWLGRQDDRMVFETS